MCGETCGHLIRCGIRTVQKQQARRVAHSSRSKRRGSARASVLDGVATYATAKAAAGASQVLRAAECSEDSMLAIAAGIRLPDR